MYQNYGAKEQYFDANPSAENYRPINPDSICVVGSGPVGIAFALRLANAGQSVTLIDSGKFPTKGKGGALHQGALANAAYASDRSDPTLVEGDLLHQYGRSDYLSWSRYLGSGGCSNLWEVQRRPSNEALVRLVPAALSDFYPHLELDIPGWATEATAVYSRYQDAFAFFDVDNQDRDIDVCASSTQSLSLPSRLFPNKVSQFARANVVKKQRMHEVVSHPNIDVRSGLHLVKIETNKQERVDTLITCDASGNTFRIKARHYVLALGGIENSRQLLLAKQDGTISDPYDVFGRWFCDHPNVRLGFLTDKASSAIARITDWYDFQQRRGIPMLQGHELSPVAAKELGLLRFSLDLVARPSGYCSRSGVTLTQILDASKRKDAKTMLTSLPTLMANPVHTVQLARSTWRKSIQGGRMGSWSNSSASIQNIDTLSVEAMFEQRPSRDNRVRLGNKRDRLGRSLPVLQWSWSRKEIESINQSADMVAKAFSNLGIGSFVTMRELGQGDIPRAGSSFHHMGGTRQSNDPANGVVNADNRVHSVENLTLIGSSVFPNTVGYANPTLTAVADALRVADNFIEHSHKKETKKEPIAQLLRV